MLLKAGLSKETANLVMMAVIVKGTILKKYAVNLPSPFNVLDSLINKFRKLQFN